MCTLYVTFLFKYVLYLLILITYYIFLLLKIYTIFSPIDILSDETKYNTYFI